ncbi:hypothetical protein ANN_24394 [Periplaneta americana]|uniref:Uncharacterized protein n=1 Tax=Periplaneta americana TaxID=6978 RepID=A0ABQ8S3F6_PERAM|nr:hypothetical protein ANN_24394 [Periplaneta americana]
MSEEAVNGIPIPLKSECARVLAATGISNEPWQESRKKEKILSRNSRFFLQGYISIAGVPEFCPTGVLLHASKSTDMSLSHLSTLKFYRPGTRLNPQPRAQKASAILTTLPRSTFKNKALRKIFEAKRDDITVEWRKLHNAELHAFYSSPDIIRNIKSRRFRWVGHLARTMGEFRNAYRVLVGRSEEFKVCHGSLYAFMWLADEPREFNLPTLPQRRITYVPQKLPSKYGVHSEEHLRKSEDQSFINLGDGVLFLDNKAKIVRVGFSEFLRLSFVISPTLPKIHF